MLCSHERTWVDVYIITHHTQILFDYIFKKWPITGSRMIKTIFIQPPNMFRVSITLPDDDIHTWYMIHIRSDGNIVLNAVERKTMKKCRHASDCRTEFIGTLLLAVGADDLVMHCTHTVIYTEKHTARERHRHCRRCCVTQQRVESDVDVHDRIDELDRMNRNTRRLDRHRDYVENEFAFVFSLFRSLSIYLSIYLIAVDCAVCGWFIHSVKRQSLRL